MASGIDFGPIQKLMDDPDVSEIMINGPKKIFMEKFGKKSLSDCSFPDDNTLMSFIQALFAPSGKRVDKELPYGDVCLEDGTRVNVIIPPVARFGVTVTLRKLSSKFHSVDDLVKIGTLTPRAADFLVACIKGKINIIFSGGTGVGKTTLLQVISNHFDPEERVITVEDAAELQMDQENVVSLETRTPDQNGKGGISIRDLIRNSLRMTPDRLVVGEVRGSEAIDMIQTMATGHAGTIGIIHGNSPRDVVSRLETMVMMSGISLPLGEVRKLIASTIQLVVHLERMSDGVRRVTHISEVRGIEQGEILFNDLFIFRIEKIEENGAIVGSLKSAIRYYPLFFNKLQKKSLVSDKIFVNE